MQHINRTNDISRPLAAPGIMDQMLPSPSFNIPSIGTPHHAMEEDQMIAPSAQVYILGWKFFV